MSSLQLFSCLSLGSRIDKLGTRWVCCSWPRKYAYFDKKARTSKHHTTSSSLGISFPFQKLRGGVLELGDADWLGFWPRCLGCSGLVCVGLMRAKLSVDSSFAVSMLISLDNILRACTTG